MCAKIWYFLCLASNVTSCFRTWISTHKINKYCVVEDDISAVSIDPSHFRQVLSERRRREFQELHLVPESELSYWRILTYLDPSLSDWRPSLYIGPRPSSTLPQFSICYSTVSTSREYIIELLSSCYFESAPHFLQTPANPESTVCPFDSCFTFNVLKVACVDLLNKLPQLLQSS